MCSVPNTPLTKRQNDIFRGYRCIKDSLGYGHVIWLMTKIPKGITPEVVLAMSQYLEEQNEYTKSNPSSLC